MSLGSMRQELLGIPGVPFGLCTTKINEALSSIQNENCFSFQLRQGGWLTPGLLGGPGTTFLSPGAITVTPFSTTITGDAVATAAWTANVAYPPLLTQQQIRVPYFSLYSIIALGTNGTVAYATTLSPGSGQTPGIYIVPVIDVTGTGTGATAQIVVDGDGTVSTTPIILTAGSNYASPAIPFAQGGFPAAFTVTLTATLTLDRPWMEPSQVNASYLIYQAYYPALPGFKRWYDITDSTNNNAMDWWSFTQVNLSERDAQRTNFGQPSHVVPYQMDTRTGSATYGQMLFELWPHPISQLPYAFACQANWPAMQQPGDIVPYPLTDEIVKLRAYEMLYMWKESQKGDEMERGSGSNWQFLMQAARAEYDDRLKRIRLMDKNLVDLYFTRMRRSPSASGQVYGTVSSQASVGGWDS